MPELLLWSGIFVASLATLVTASRYFTEAAEVIGLSLGMSPFAVGVLIVATGTSLPELITAIFAVQKQASEIVAGNILGAGVSNLLFVLGVASLLSKENIRLESQNIAIDLNYLIGSAALLLLVMRDGRVEWTEGVLGAVAYVAFLFYIFREGNQAEDLVISDDVKEMSRAGKARPKDLLTLVVSGVFIYFGANYTIDALERIAEGLGVSRAVISITMLSLGTTLPESVVSATAALKGKGEIAVGNILGSCIFNALAIVSVATAFGAIRVPDEILRLPLPAYLGASILFYLLARDKNVSRWEGVLFLVLYALFIAQVAFS
ncbi:MAG: calcium/sodium antiporter [Chloroherpetonaceae bacterium]|nr:calcium/sodium antiporter [Chloroherpetonaceae bacterium]MDW8438231.1 calcium/sodium antiporter [Chloroherpetonaceae bacterium]